MPNDQHRRVAKMIRFAALYGASVETLARIIERGANEAHRSLYDAYREGQRAAHEDWRNDLKLKEGIALQSLQEEVAIEWGEKRDEAGQSSQRVYFFYVTPTGIETGMKECNQIKPKWSKGGNTDFFGNRTAQMGYAVSGPFTMKMVCLGSVFGKPRQRNHLFINVNPSLERIEVIGPEGFGKFTGRGEVDLKASGYTKAQFEKIFKLEVLASRVGKASKNVRSLIY